MLKKLFKLNALSSLGRYMDVIWMDYLFQLASIKQRVGKVDSGFKREYREDTIACGAKIVQFLETATTRFGCKIGRISRAKIIAATKVCDLLNSRKKRKI